MAMSPEQMAVRMGLDIPDFAVSDYYGADYGTMKPFHLMGNLLFLSGHVAQIGADITHKGRLGTGLTTEQGYAAAWQTGVNVLGGIRQAVGSLDRVKAIVRTLNFVVCAPGYEDVTWFRRGFRICWSRCSAATEGLAARIAGRATIGVMALAAGVCFENWATVEVEG